MSFIKLSSITSFIKTHLWVIAVFIGIGVFFYFPALQGKLPYQSDILQYNGMAHARNELRTSGEESYYTQSAFGGMPTYQLGAHYSYQGVKWVDRIIRFLPRPIDYLFLYFVSFYVLMLSLRVDYRVAALGSIAFGLATYHLIIIDVGHNAKAHAIGYFPLVLASIFYLFRSSNWLKAGLFLTASLALELVANHYQMTYYLFLLIGTYLFFELLKSIKAKDLGRFSIRIGVFLTALIGAIALNATSILATKQYAAFSTRGTSELKSAGDHADEGKTSGLSFEYITAYSYGIAESFNIIIPRLYGGSNSEILPENSAIGQFLDGYSLTPSEKKEFTSKAPLYFGKQPIVAAPAYLGVSVFFLFVLAVLTLPLKSFRWLYIGLVLALMLSWGKNFPILSRIFIDYFPLYNKFRAVSSIQVLLSLGIPLLAVLGFSSWRKEPDYSKLVKALYITVGVLVVATLLPLVGDFSGPNDLFYENAYGSDYIDALRADRKSLVVKDAFRSILFTLLTAAGLWVIGKYRDARFTGFVLLIVLIDLGGVASRYISVDDFVSAKLVKEPFKQSEVDRAILADTDYFRVFNINEGLNGASTSYWHHSIGGYHAAKPAFIQQLFDVHLANEQYQVLDLLNIKYLISIDDQGTSTYSLYPTRKGAAWISSSLSYENNLDSIFNRLPEISLANEAVVFGTNSLEPYTNRTISSTEHIETTHVKENRIEYKFSLENPAFVVFSEWYYTPSPGDWVLRDQNSNILPIYRTNYAFMGTYLPKGEGTISLSFEPKIIATTLWVRLIAQVIFIVLLGFLLIKMYWKKSDL